MSKGNVVLTTVAATGMACVVVAAICAWTLVTDPAGLLPVATDRGASLVSLVARTVIQAASMLLAWLGW
ncbi:MAG: hypothetical protein AB7H96_22575 [Vicinamibacterales bacterium]